MDLLNATRSRDTHGPKEGDRALSTKKLPTWWLLASFPYLFSFVAHLCVIVSLAFVYFGAAGVNLVTLVASNSEWEDAVEIDSVAPDDSPPGAAEADTLLPIVEQIEIAASAISIDFDDAAEETITGESAVGQVSRASLQTGTRGGSPNGLNGGLGGYFGIESYGEKFVYIVDCSTSMSGRRWDRATSELLKTVANMGPTQQFFVFCFGYTAHPMFDLPMEQFRFAKPDDGTRRKLRTWIRALPLEPSTQPADAVRMALAMKPDAIYLLSDGELADNTVEVLRTLNRDRLTGDVVVPVHTISLYSQQGQATLRVIAQENNGRYVEIR